MTSHFVQCIWNFGSAVNYNIAYSKAAHKYLLKAFYNKTNQKEYNSQIRQHNICHMNIIAIKDVIAVAERGRENGELLVIKNMDKTVIAEVAKVSSAIKLGHKYSQAISNADIDVAGNLGLIDIKNIGDALAKFKMKQIDYIKIGFLYLEHLSSTLGECIIMKK